MLRLVFEKTQSIDFFNVVASSTPGTLKEMLDVLQKIDRIADYLPHAVDEIPKWTDDTEWLAAAFADGRDALLKEENKRSLISWSCEYHRPKTLAFLVEKWPDLAEMKKSRWGNGMLHTLADAAREKRPDDFESCLKILLDLGFDPHGKDWEGLSPADLLIASKKKECFSRWERVVMSGIKKGKGGKGGKPRV